MFTNAVPAPGAYTVLVADLPTFVAKYGAGVPIGGTYSRKLGNRNDDLRLEISSLNAAILDFEYQDSWYPTTDGGGSSLSILDAAGLRSSWGPSPS